MFLNDQETEVDLLHYEAIAKTVIKLIRANAKTPVTIGVHGDWGAGKSSVLRMTKAVLEKDERVVCLWFNGWAFEGFEDAKTVVIETIVDGLRKARPTSEKVKAAAKKLFKRVDWLKVARKAGGYAFTAATGVPTFDQLSDLAGLAGTLVDKAAGLSGEDLKDFAEKAKDFVKEGKDEGDHLPEQIREFRKEFDELLDAADIDQLVVIVDDLDRCLPATAIATLEAIRLFMFEPKTAFVIGADELMVEYAVRAHFPDLPPSSGSVPYARNYLEKLIQVPFRIPSLGLAETKIYIALLLAENGLGSEHAHFKVLLDLAQSQLQRPWESRGLDRQAIEDALKEKVPEAIDHALILSDRVSKILADGTRGNPRQIKRFLNSMMLRYSIAEERGFADAIKFPVLAKIMLAERFSPEFYEQLARSTSSAADGKPASLKLFEEAVTRGEGEVKPEKAESAGRKVDGEAKGKRVEAGAEEAKAAPSMAQAEADEWAKSEWAKGWAGIQPSLTGEDLRPYVFVTRDKRSYLNAAFGRGALDTIIDRLMGSKLMVAGTGADVEKLSGTEPEDVFEEIRARIVQADSFKTEPAGARGLARLVEAHPNLQRRLLGFLESLPTERLGAWAPSWGPCFKDPALTEAYYQLLKKWADQPDNKLLALPAATAIKLRKS